MTPTPRRIAPFWSAPALGWNLLLGIVSVWARWERSHLEGLAFIGNVSQGTELRIQEEPDLAQMAQQHATMWLLSRDGSDLDLFSLKESAYKTFPEGLGIEGVAQMWITGSLKPEYASRWVILLGGFGVGLLTVVAGLGLAADVVNSARNTRSVAALTERHGWLLVLSAVETLCPLALTSCVAAVSYYVLPTGIRYGGSVVGPSWEYAIGAVVTGVLVGAVLSIVAARSMAKQSENWFPDS